MESHIWKHSVLLIILNLIINFLCLSLGQPVFLEQFCKVNRTNSGFQTNLDAVLSSLSSNIDEYGFYSSSFGQEPNTSYAMALCRSDFEIKTCRACINYATIKLRQMCPDSKKAGGWYGECAVRYSNTPDFGRLETLPSFYWWSNHYALNVKQFSAAFSNLLERLRIKAASGGIHQKFSVANATGPDLTTIYGFAQCIPDLSEEDCSQCLLASTNVLAKAGKKDARVLMPSCYLEFKTHLWYNETRLPNYKTLAADAPQPPPTSRAVKNGLVVASTVGFMISLTFCVYVFASKQKRRTQRQRAENTSSFLHTSDMEYLEYNFNAICAATNDFSNANKLGHGGFGDVYKGKLPSGQEIAVKRLNKNSRQGNQEFKNEVMLVAKLSHRNLVKLLGFCLEGSERLLIYEFMRNSSLDRFIFSPIKSKLLDWEKRYKIINGIAKGLLYLHEDSRLRIIHRDLKSSNVLLDEKFSPKIADFGMARLVVKDETQGITSRIVGTYGYMSPEYAMYGKFSVKSDVFSFGVLILEITSGKRNNHFCNGDNVENLISYAWMNWCNGTALSLIDPTLVSGMNSPSEILRCIHIGLLCVQENVSARPTMASVVIMLSSLSVELPLPSKPAFLYGEYVSAIANDSSLVSQNEISSTEMDPR